MRARYGCRTDFLLWYPRRFVTQDTETLKRVDIYKSVGYISQHHPSTFFRKRGEGPLYLCPFAPPPTTRATQAHPLCSSLIPYLVSPPLKEREREREIYIRIPQISPWLLPFVTTRGRVGISWCNTQQQSTIRQGLCDNGCCHKASVTTCITY